MSQSLVASLAKTEAGFRTSCTFNVIYENSVTLHSFCYVKATPQILVRHSRSLVYELQQGIPEHPNQFCKQGFEIWFTDVDEKACFSLQGLW